MGYIDLEKKLFSYKTTAGNILRSYKLIFHEQKTVFILKILSLTVAPILSYIILLLSKNAINRIEQSNSSFLYVVLCVSVIIVLEIVSVVYDRILFFFSDLTSSAFSERLRSDLLRKIADEVPVSKLETPEFFNKIGTINAGGIESVVGSITTPLTLLTSIVYLAIAVYTSLQYNFYLYYLYIIILPFVFILETISKRHFTLNYDKKDNLQRKAGVLNSLLQNKSTIFDIKTSDSEEWLINETEKRKKAAFHFSQKESIISSVLLLTRDVLNYAFKYSILIYLVVKLYEGSKQVTYYSLYIIYAFMVFSKSILFGDFIFLTSNISKVMNSVHSIIGAISGFVTNQEYFNEHELFFSLPERANGTKKFDEKDPKNILTDKLSYGYSAERKVLNSLCMEIKEGEKVCVFGDNGAGKTTLIKLICGLYEDYRGKILLQNNERHSYEKDEIRNLYSYAMQDGPHYPFTVKENICMGNTADADNQNLYDKVCSVSGINQIVSQLRYGENTYLNKEYDTNGVDLSIGQWQKLLIAKIMFRNKEILIFDEPTSALDPLAEQEFINTLLSWYKNKTVVIISHRMTFASIADRVFVIKDGAVAEQGTPKQLLNAKGLFYEYFNTQRSLYF